MSVVSISIAVVSVRMSFSVVRSAAVKLSSMVWRSVIERSWVNVIAFSA